MPVDDLVLKRPMPSNEIGAQGQDNPPGQRIETRAKREKRAKKED